MYASKSFKYEETKYSLRYKEYLSVKNNITRFMFFLKPMKFIVRTYLKHMASMLQNESLLEQGNNRIFKWILWIDGYNIDINYKPRKKEYC